MPGASSLDDTVRDKLREKDLCLSSSVSGVSEIICSADTGSMPKSGAVSVVKDLLRDSDLTIFFTPSMLSREVPVLWAWMLVMQRLTTDTGAFGKNSFTTSDKFSYPKKSPIPHQNPFRG